MENAFLCVMIPITQLTLMLLMKKIVILTPNAFAKTIFVIQIISLYDLERKRKFTKFIFFIFLFFLGQIFVFIIRLKILDLMIY